MADVQQSGPLVGENLTDETWRAIFGADTGITNDRDGTAFGLTLPPTGDDVEIGSATQDSTAVVGGFVLRIPQSTTQSLTIPASSNGGNGRTDLIVLRLDLDNFTDDDPGPVRLHRVGGVEGSTTVPSPTVGTTGVLDLPLFAITRKLGQPLASAAVSDLRARMGLMYDVPNGAPLPSFAPLGARASRGTSVWRRDVVGTSVDWVQESNLRTVLAGTNIATTGADWVVRPAARLSRDGVERWANIVVGLAGSPVNPNQEVDGERRVARLLGADRPPTSVPLTGFAQNTAGLTRAAQGRIDPDGWVVWYWASTTGRFPTGSTVALSGVWELNA